MTTSNSSSLRRRSRTLAAALLGIGALLGNPAGFTAPALAQSAMDQLRDAAGGNRDHEFDGSRHDDSRGPAPTPSVPDPGPGKPVNSN